MAMIKKILSFTLAVFCSYCTWEILNPQTFWQRLTVLPVIWITVFCCMLLGWCKNDDEREN